MDGSGMLRFLRETPAHALPSPPREEEKANVRARVYFPPAAGNILSTLDSWNPPCPPSFVRAPVVPDFRGGAAGRRRQSRDNDPVSDKVPIPRRSLRAQTRYLAFSYVSFTPREERETKGDSSAAPFLRAIFHLKLQSSHRDAPKMTGILIRQTGVLTAH
jgi:hypothetical protein